MIHPIKSFRSKDYGLFMDLASGDTLAVNTASGDVQFSHDGVTAFIRPAECRGFELRKQSVHRHQVSIRYTDKTKQVVGYTEDESLAKNWIESANLVIAKHRPAVKRHPAVKCSKRYKKVAEMIPTGKAFTLEEAAELLRKLPGTKFNQTVTLSFRMGVDPKKSDQMVRGTCPLPHGSGKTVRVAVFAQGAAAEAAKAAGADIVGNEDLIAKVKEGFTDFDVAIATPAAMTEVRKLGKQLGPRGLMPNPRTGTVTDDTAAAVKAVKAGRADFKLDKNGNIASSVGKASFEVAQLAENATSLIEAVVRAKPASARGRYVETITLAATMSPALRIDVSKYIKL